MVEAAQSLQIIPENQGVEVLMANFDQQALATTLQVTNKLRQLGIKTELYPNIDKLGKQFKYADQNKIPYVFIVGEEETKNQTVSIKNMQTGEQKVISVEKLDSFRQTW